MSAPFPAPGRARMVLLAVAAAAAPLLAPAACAAQPPQPPPTMQRSIDLLVRSLQERRFALLEPQLDETFRAPGLAPAAARQLLRQVVDAGLRVPTAVRVESIEPDGALTRVSARFTYGESASTLALLLTDEGKFVQIPLFRVQAAPGFTGELPAGGVRIGAGSPPAPGGAGSPGAAVAQPSLRAELRAMLEVDQRRRRELSAAPGPEAVRALAALDSAHAARLREIVDAHGWPDRAMVGDDGAAAAMLILQHADLQTQERFLPLVRRAVDGGELAPSLLATLEDRVRMRQGRDQLYGTQLHKEPGEPPRLWPVEDEANVDRRRAAVGLPPLAMYLRGFGIEYTGP